MQNPIRKMWLDHSGEDVAEYALMLAVILVLVVSVVKVIGENASNIFNSTANAIQ